MCSFIFTNKEVTDLEHINQFAKFRGPDLTNSLSKNGYTFIHNLLSITGDFIKQPFEQDGIVCIYNGEIYNYDSFGEYESDGQCLIPLYKKYGDTFIQKLDGEFAIVLVDFNKDKLIVSSDIFATKPIYIGFKETDKIELAIASYASSITRLGIDTVNKIPANTIGVYKLSSLEFLNEYPVYEFDINQHKDTYDDWITAFEESIHKRSRDLSVKAFLGLSSGYDSGAIACELHKQNKDFRAYSILAAENKQVLEARSDVIQDTEMIEMTRAEYFDRVQYLKENGEEFSYNSRYKNYNYKGDKASNGLAAICDRGHKQGYRIYFSGQGADEILSDYGHSGHKIYGHSEFGGKFPNDLSSLFPWYSFYDGTQIQYLNKEEYVAGTYSIETRYPFLDKKVVQEFLWLKADLKNKYYKGPLHMYLQQNEFPFEPGKKIGFGADKNLK